MLKNMDYVQVLMDNSPSTSGGPPSQRVETPEGIPSKVGWHEDSCGNPIQVAKDPKLFRTPEARFDGEAWPYRTTWILRMNAWTKVEDKVKWSKLSEPKAIIKPIAEKAIFKFEKDIKLGAPSVARSGIMTNVIEHTRHNLDDPYRKTCIFIKNGRTTRFSKLSAYELSDHAMSICWAYHEFNQQPR